MKRSTAVHHVFVVAQRLRDTCGIVCVPNAGHGAVRVRRAWVFGSTAKGADSPNDVDILIDCSEVGPWSAWSPGRKLDRRYRRSFGICLMPDATERFIIWLRSGMTKVSVHRFSQDGRLLANEVKVMIYPRMDFSPEGAAQ